MARNFRRWLWKAGVRRAALHETSPTSQNMTWHDLRATGATWMAVHRDDPLKIMQRCGHADYNTTQRYVREAEAVRDGFGHPFPPLPGCLLGIAPKSPRAIHGSRSSLKQAVFSGVDGTRTWETAHKAAKPQGVPPLACRVDGREWARLETVRARSGTAHSGRPGGGHRERDASAWPPRPPRYSPRNVPRCAPNSASL
ncbi:MAG: site-specific integrase [Polyangiaceae bacterium]